MAQRPPLDAIAIAAVVLLAAAGRGWQIVHAYRRGLRRLRERRRLRAERALFDRLERSMLAERVENGDC